MEILVEGSAERMVSPDVGELFLMLEQEGNDREFVVGLTSELARRFSEAVAPLRPASVVRWSLDPIRVHTWRPEEGTLRYRAMANSKILFRDFQALADFAVSWGSAPGVEIHYTDWRLSPGTGAGGGAGAAAGGGGGGPPPRRGHGHCRRGRDHQLRRALRPSARLRCRCQRCVDGDDRSLLRRWGCGGAQGCPSQRHRLCPLPGGMSRG